MSNPLYNIDDVVYLRESAILGWLESYSITQVRSLPDGQWCYRFVVAEKAPSNTTVGDQNNLKSSVDWEVAENELLTYCDALALVIAYLERRLTEMKALQSSHCDTGTD